MTDESNRLTRSESDLVGRQRATPLKPDILMTGVFWYPSGCLARPVIRGVRYQQRFLQSNEARSNENRNQSCPCRSPG